MTNFDEAGSGEFKLQYATGSYRLGKAVAGECVFYESYDPQGKKVHENCVVEPLEDGRSLVKWDNGATLLCRLEDMRPQGAYVHTYPNGGRQEGVHVDGVREPGSVVYFDKFGKKISAR